MRTALLLVLLLAPPAFCLLTSSISSTSSAGRQSREPSAAASSGLASTWTTTTTTTATMRATQHKISPEALGNHLSNHQDDDDDDDERQLRDSLHNDTGTQEAHSRLARRRRRRADQLRRQALEAAGARLTRRQAAAPEDAGAHCASAPAIFGVRCDECNEVHDGILVIMANAPTELLLVGRNFGANISVALTPEGGVARADCTHADRVRSLNFRSVSSSIARIVIDVPAPANELRPYYLCLRDLAGHWHHQGSEPWLKLYVKEDFLPVYMKIIVVAVLLMLSGLFSGLNLGLMALDKNELQVIISCGSDTEKRYARAIEPVRRRGNYLLCSILFSNVLVNSTIAVLLEELTSGIVAVMTSTIFIVMFGEILPQAFCSRHGLAVGAKTVSITYFCMIVTFPLSYPVSRCLDWALGEEIGHAYDRERLMEFIRVTRDYNNLETDEVNIIQGALKLKRIPLSEVMTRIEDVFMLDLGAALDFDTIQAIIERGYSRVPVHEPGNKKNIVALLFAKDLALLDPDDKTPVQTLISFYNHPIMYLFEDETLDLALDEFKTGKSHMAFVRRVLDDGDRDPVYEITGVVTLEDVIEEIMQMEINDETDILSDNKRKRRRKEAQVRRDFSQFAHFGAGESSFSVASPQLCLAAYQYLATTVDAFSPKFISDLILKRLLAQKIYFRARLEDELSARALYAAGEPADYFVMILEGRVRVVCGKEGLTFEGGPFTYFGKAALRAPPEHPDTPALALALAHADERRLSTGGGGGGSPRLARGQDEQRPPQRASTASHRLSVTSGPLASLIPSRSRVSLESMSGSATSAQVLPPPPPPPPPPLFFVPDYSVEIVADTSYLKIKSQEYLAALKASALERNSPAAGSALEPDSPRPRPKCRRASTANEPTGLATGNCTREEVK